MRVDRASQNVYVNEAVEGKILPAGRSKGKLAVFLERKGLGAIRGATGGLLLYELHLGNFSQKL